MNVNSTRDEFMPISNDFEQIERAAIDTAAVYLDAAVERIDAKFGEGYAKQNPMLTGAFMQTVAMDFHTSATRVSTQRIGMVLEEVIGSNLNNIEESMCRAIAEAG